MYIYSSIQSIFGQISENQRAKLPALMAFLIERILKSKLCSMVDDGQFHDRE